MESYNRMEFDDTEELEDAEFNRLIRERMKRRQDWDQESLDDDSLPVDPQRGGARRTKDYND